VRRLTEFYMWISAGGVAGGMACGLIAPFAFPGVWEYPILIVLALMCRPGAFADPRAWVRGSAIFAAALALAMVPRVVFGLTIPIEVKPYWMLGLVVVAALIMLQAAHAARLVALTAFVLIVTAVYEPGLVMRLTARSFFGVHKVVDSYDGRFRMLYHGTTSHGAQRLRDETGAPAGGPPEPLTYYYFGGPLSQAIASARAAKGTLQRVAVVGLGTGSLACHARPGERWSYFEIDPVVVRIARDPSRFRFMSECARNADVVLGDARLTLAEAQGRFDLIVLDAFSSDVVPVHLLTTEALGIYLAKLSPGGVLVLHISNRFMELASVVAAGAAAHGLVAYVKADSALTDADFERSLYASSLVAVVAHREQDLSALHQHEGWAKRTADGSVAPWRDDYANILSAIWRMQRR
jgi:spermidine synthase